MEFLRPRHHRWLVAGQQMQISLLRQQHESVERHQVVFENRATISGSIALFLGRSAPRTPRRALRVGDVLGLRGYEEGPYKFMPLYNLK